MIIVWSFDSQLQHYSVVNKFTVCMKLVLIFACLNRYIFRYKSMKSGKTSKIDKWNECVVDFYRLIDTIDFNQIRFTDFYPFTTPGILQCVAHKSITTLRRLPSQCFGGKEIAFLFNC